MNPSHLLPLEASSCLVTRWRVNEFAYKKDQIYFPASFYNGTIVHQVYVNLCKWETLSGNYSNVLLDAIGDRESVVAVRRQYEVASSSLANRVQKFNIEYAIDGIRNNHSKVTRSIIMECRRFMDGTEDIIEMVGFVRYSSHRLVFDLGRSYC